MPEITRENEGARRHGAWHADTPYDPREQIRIERAAELLAEHATACSSGRRYRLLDVGCGVGPMREWLPAERFEITGLEISEEAAGLARQRYDACLVTDVETDWPIEPGSFDGVHAGAVLEHVADWHAPLNQANRVLGDGGLLTVSVPNLRYWKEIRRLILGRQPHWTKDMAHLHTYTPRFLRELVSLHGFDVLSLEADRVNLPGLGRWERFGARRLAGVGSVLILSAKLARRTRIEDVSQAARWPGAREVGLRSVEVPAGGGGGATQ